jgi:hypothetical protein
MHCAVCRYLKQCMMGAVAERTSSVLYFTLNFKLSLRGAFQMVVPKCLEMSE